MTKLESDIIKILKENAREEIANIATLVSATEDEVKSAIAKLENEGVIVKYSAIVNEDQFFGDGVQALIEVKVNTMKEKGYDEIASYLGQFSEVKNLYLMSGAYDLAIFIEGKNLREVARFVSEKLSCINHVQSVATHFILKKYKVEGVSLENENKERLIIHP